ncbi:MAG: hypothetical protein HZA61_12675 [Candidatus Eisenbacteria bacterium]|uniref:Outer membrane protein beta-barrel domain-containing protein n=1 Tax=Eiseniibacteriota bacterium TaxID=2212470 RepID=A0A933W2R2_UNCEI|nr:hypothetical protein [Candidatus Eisenbacteria bacterium]
MSRMSGPSAVLVAALLCALLPAAAQASRRISSDPSVPDSSRVLGSDLGRVPTAALPVWFGVDNEFALLRNEWENMPRTGSRARFGATIYVPVQQVGARNWTSVTYEEDELEARGYVTWYDGTDFTYVPVTFPVPTTMFSVRTGLDRVAGSETRPSAFLGAGLGVGFGLFGASLGSDTRHWTSYEFAVRGGLYAYSSKNARFGVVGLGVVGYRLAPDDLRDVIAEFQLGVAIEGALQLPKRFVEPR